MRTRVRTDGRVCVRVYMYVRVCTYMMCTRMRAYVGVRVTCAHVRAYARVRAYVRFERVHMRARNGAHVRACMRAQRTCKHMHTNIRMMGG